MRRPNLRNNGSLNSSSSRSTCRLTADCETCRRSPAAVNDPLSAIARRISSCLKSISVGPLPRCPRTPRPNLHVGGLFLLHRLEERHQRTQPRADFLDPVLLLARPRGVEPRAPLRVFVDPALG